MTIFHTIILGILEGITEFLPVSSTGHLLLASNLFSISDTTFTSLFIVVIQFGAILSVISIFFKSICKKGMIEALIAAFIPTAIVGYLLYTLIKSFLFHNLSVIASAWVVGGALILFFDSKYSAKKESANTSENNIPTVRHAFLIGLAQSFAVIPGVSRSLATILAGESLGMSRENIVRFSFLLAVPTIGAASLYDLYKSYNSISWHNEEIMLLSIGFVTAWISAYIVTRWFLAYVRTHSFKLFGWYRIAIGGVLLIALLLGFT